MTLAQRGMAGKALQEARAKEVACLIFDCIVVFHMVFFLM